MRTPLLYYLIPIPLGLLLLFWLYGEQQGTQRSALIPLTPTQDTQQAEVNKPAQQTTNASQPVQTSPNTKLPTTTDVDVQKPQPMWKDADFEVTTLDQPGQWVSESQQLGFVHLDQSFFDSLVVGKVLRLPVTPPLDYRLTEVSDVVNTSGNSWMAVQLNQQGEPINRYGVITTTPEALFVTLHSNSGIYYLHSTNKSTAELAYVSYQDLYQRNEETQ